MSRPLVVVRAALALVAAPVHALAAQAAATTPASPPLVRGTRLAAADLRADLALLRSAYEALHPGLHRYLTPAQVDSAFTATDAYFATDRTLAESFLALTRLTAAVRCGHSYPNFWNQSARVGAALLEGHDRVPFRFRWLDRRMIVTHDRSGSALPPGTEVLAIGGVPARAILDTLLPFARADGGNDAKRVSYLEVQDPARFHAFDVLYALRFGGDTAYTLRVRRPGSAREATVRVRALTAAERRERDAGRATAEDAVPWRYTEADGLAVLRMPTWSVYDAKGWVPRAWVDSVMSLAVAHDVPDLVLDLRGNEGGVDAGDFVLAHLVDAPLAKPSYRRWVRYRSAPDSLRPYLDTWDRSFMDWGDAARGPQQRDGMPFYRLTRWDDDTTGANRVAPAGPRYRGRVWVLVGAANSSATFQFARTVQQSRVGTLVGQPTGGNRRGINGGGFFFLRLPRTGIEVDVPLVATFPETPEPDAGVVPDLPVVATAAQVAAGIDPEMRAVRARIARLRATTPLPAARGR